VRQLTLKPAQVAQLQGWLRGAQEDVQRIRTNGGALPALPTAHHSKHGATAADSRAAEQSDSSSMPSIPESWFGLSTPQARRYADKADLQAQLEQHKKHYAFMQWAVEVRNRRRAGWEGEVPGPSGVSPYAVYSIPTAELDAWEHGKREEEFKQIQDLVARLHRIGDKDASEF
jgi:hypothetical protein